MLKNTKLLSLLLFVFLSGAIFTSCLNKNNKPQSIHENTAAVEHEINESTDSSTPDYIESSMKEYLNEDNPTVLIPDDNILDNTLIQWGFKPNTTHTTPDIPGKVKLLLSKYSGYYVGDTSSKVIYLTFDEGYENGYTGKILDILKANNVRATFFVTKPYILQNKELITRMVREGHVVGNHSSKHPSMPTRTGDINAFNFEFSDTEKAFRDVTGLEMPRFFRPPMGEFSEKSLAMTQQLGYRTILWSFAHKDWEVNNQPSIDETLNKIMTRSHNGEIMLLHAVSKTNTEALDSIIKELQSIGYRFGDLRELR